MLQITIVIAFAMARWEPDVAVYSTLDSPVIIASMGGPTVAVYSAMDSPVIARKGVQLL